MTGRFFRPAEFGIYMAPRAKTSSISSLIAMESWETDARALCQKLVLVNDAKQERNVRSEMQTLTLALPLWN